MLPHTEPGPLRSVPLPHSSQGGLLWRLSLLEQLEFNPDCRPGGGGDYAPSCPGLVWGACAHSSAGPGGPQGIRTTQVDAAGLGAWPSHGARSRSACLQSAHLRSCPRTERRAAVACRDWVLWGFPTSSWCSLAHRHRKAQPHPLHTHLKQGTCLSDCRAQLRSHGLCP